MEALPLIFNILPLQMKLCTSERRAGLGCKDWALIIQCYIKNVRLPLTSTVAKRSFPDFCFNSKNLKEVDSKLWQSVLFIYISYDFQIFL